MKRMIVCGYECVVGEDDVIREFRKDGKIYYLYRCVYGRTRGKRNEVVGYTLYQEPTVTAVRMLASKRRSKFLPEMIDSKMYESKAEENEYEAETRLQKMGLYYVLCTDNQVIAVFMCDGRRAGIYQLRYNRRHMEYRAKLYPVLHKLKPETLRSGLYRGCYVIKAGEGNDDQGQI